MHLLWRLLHYFAASMVIAPVVLVLLAGVDYFDRSIVHNQFTWIPILMVMVGLSMWLFVVSANRG